MRFVLIFTACVLTAIIALQFAGERPPIRPYENMSVIVLCGGDEWGLVQQSVAAGRDLAIEELGCTVELVFTDWSSDSETTNFQQVLSVQPTGICVMGYPSYEEYRMPVEDARELEVYVTSFNTPIESLESRYSRDGFGFAGIDGFQAGYDLGKAAVKKHATPSGATAMILGALDHPARKPFHDGCTAAFEEAGLNVTRMVTDMQELQHNRQAIAETFRTMKADDALPALLCFTEIPIRLASSILEYAGIDGGELPLIGLGLDPNTDALSMAPGRRRRHVSLLVSQDLSLQTTLAILQVCMSAGIAAPGLHIDTPYRILGAGEARSEFQLRGDENLYIEVH